MSYVKFRKQKYFSLNLITGFAFALSFVMVTACTDQARALNNKPNFVHKAAPRPGVMLKIGDKEITRDALIENAKLEFFDLEKRQYEMMMDQTRKILIQELIGPEAKKANMTIDEYIDKKVIGKEIKVSDAEYKKFVTERHIPEAQITPQIKERIIAFKKTEIREEKVDAHIAKITKNAPVEIYFEKPRLAMNVEVGDAPVFGKKNAPVTIVEFSDFQCPYCNRAADTVVQLKKKYPNQVRVAFRHFPLPMHSDARPAAEASMCINEQGEEKFWKFHDVIFKNQDKLDKANLEKFAKDVGADVKKFSDCVAAKKFAGFVQKDLEYGEKIGVKSTPTFFVNGQIVSGAVPMETFAQIIEEELSSKAKN